MNQPRKAPFGSPKSQHITMSTLGSTTASTERGALPQHKASRREKAHREILGDNDMGSESVSASAWRSRHPTQHRRIRAWFGEGRSEHGTRIYSKMCYQP